MNKRDVFYANVTYDFWNNQDDSVYDNEKTFPIKTITINGKKFIKMQSDIFCDFFIEVSKRKFDEKLINNLVNQFKYAKKNKKKRIRFKKEKEVLLKMYYILYSLVDK